MVDLKSYIRSIPDFPKPGILFRDITPLLQNPIALRQAIDMLAFHWKDVHIDRIVGIEARGFVVGTALAYKLKVGISLVRKKNKLPYKTIGATYQLEYGEDTLEMHVDAIEPGSNVLVIDDLLATGGTARAAVELVEKLKGKVIGIGFLIELVELGGRMKLPNYDVYSLMEFEGE